MELATNSALNTALVFLAWFLVSYLYHGVGITLGYHRLLTHKSAKVPKWLLYFIVSGGYLCLMGGPVNWVGVHRLHHQKSDTEDDPHSPIAGFRHALYGWMLTMGERQTTEQLHKQVPDLLKDKVLCWFGTDHSDTQAKLCLSFCILFRCILYIIAGPVAVIANVLATFIVFWSPQLVNSICHMQNHGYRLFETKDLSRNVWWVGILACGEGWHNTHHAYPKSAQHGIMWWEFDVTWITICILEKLGLATDVIRPSNVPVRIPDQDTVKPVLQTARKVAPATVAKEAAAVAAAAVSPVKDAAAAAAAAAVAPVKDAATAAAKNVEAAATAAAKTANELTEAAAAKTAGAQQQLEDMAASFMHEVETTAREIEASVKPPIQSNV